MMKVTPQKAKVCTVHAFLIICCFIFLDLCVMEKTKRLHFFHLFSSLMYSGQLCTERAFEFDKFFLCRQTIGKKSMKTPWNTL